MADPTFTPLTHLPAWRAMQPQIERMRHTHLRDLCQDATRNQSLRLTGPLGIQVDLSRQPLDAAVLHGLIQVALARNVAGARSAMFAGERINVSEYQPALHTALRASSYAPVNAVAQATAQRARMYARVAQLKVQNCRTILHLGIGGSDLGPRLVVQALGMQLPTQIDIKFMPNVDGHVLSTNLATLDPHTTWVCVASKTFKTVETLRNAQSLREWFIAHQIDPNERFIALTAAPANAQAWGVIPENVMEFSGWVGGRFSLWSVIGFPIVAAFGPTVFDQLLDGAAQMDAHFAQADLPHNLAVLLALTDVLNRNALDRHSRMMAPYDERLRYLPAYLQQLEMESNGKRSSTHGAPLQVDTASPIFGNVGTLGQHSYFQCLHQGTEIIPTEFILVAQPHHQHSSHHALMWANALAQMQALAVGKATSQHPTGLEAHQQFEGNRPSTLIVLPRLEANVLGALLALYEHRTFVQSILWGNNAFDQMGVEYGKAIASTLEPALLGHDVQSSMADAIAAHWIAQFKPAS